MERREMYRTNSNIKVCLLSINYEWNNTRVAAQNTEQTADCVHKTV